MPGSQETHASGAPEAWKRADSACGEWRVDEVALPEKRVKQAGGKDGKAERVKGCHGFGEGTESQAAEGM